MGRLWKKLVKLYHPDRFAHEPDKLETYAKLTAAINRAKDEGDIGTLREIADDPHGFILRQGGRVWISATEWNWRSGGGCMRRCNRKSSTSSKR